MKKVFLSVFVAAAAVILGTGCTEPVVFSEVFQQGENEKLYTAYNIWYTDPEDISCLNIQQGTFIPVGTEIEPVETSVCCNFLGLSGFNEKISFRDKSGKVYIQLIICSYYKDIKQETQSFPKDIPSCIP